jgi:WD40 repeat protein
MAVGAVDEVFVVDLQARREIHRYRHPDSIMAVPISPDGQMVASGGSDRTARLVDVKARRETARIHYDATVRSLAFTADGEWLVTATALNHLMLRWHRTGRDDLLRDACSAVGRDLTKEEWQQYLAPEAYRMTCSDRP